MKIQTKILLILAIVAVAFLAVIASAGLWERHRFGLLLRNKAAEKKEFFDKLVALKGEPLETYAYDYTIWDDMVRMVEKDDIAWAKQNIDTSLPTYKTDAAWVLRPDFTLVYSANRLNSKDLEAMPLSREELGRMTAKAYFTHFFMVSGGEVVEVRGAPIQPTADIKRETRPRGFYFVGRVWNGDFLKGVSALTESAVTLRPAAGAGPPDGRFIGEDGTVTVTENLAGWDGRPVARVYSTTRPHLIDELGLSLKRQLILTVSLVLFLMALLSYLLLRRVSRPLQLVMRSLDREDTEALAGLKCENSDLGRLAKMAVDYIVQKRRLLQEISERKQSERERSRLLADLRLSNRELKEFAYLASHDLQSPVRKIVSFSQLLGKTLKDRLTPDERENLGFLISGALRMQRLNNDLLAYYRVMTGGNPETVSVTELIDVIIGSELSVLLLETGGRIEVDASGMSLYGDRDQLYQLMLNLLDNALKYSADGRVPAVKVACRDLKDVVKVEVSDNGPGIGEEYREKVFQLFQRLQGAERYQGTGVGLSICRKIVRRHGGSIGVISKPGQGSTFWFIIPKAGQARMGRGLRDAA